MIERIIKEYLATNKRLIVPGMGAFIRKDDAGVAFVPFMKKDDGVLTGLISAAFDTDESGAVQVVEEFSGTVKAVVDREGYYVLEGLGKFRKDINGALSFEFAGTTDGSPGEPAAMPSAGRQPEKQVPLQRTEFEKALESRTDEGNKTASVEPQRKPGASINDIYGSKRARNGEDIAVGVLGGGVLGEGAIGGDVLGEGANDGGTRVVTGVAAMSDAQAAASRLAAGAPANDAGKPRQVPGARPSDSPGAEQQVARHPQPRPAQPQALGAHVTHESTRPQQPVQRLQGAHDSTQQPVQQPVKPQPQVQQPLKPQAGSQMFQGAQSSPQRQPHEAQRPQGSPQQPSQQPQGSSQPQQPQRPQGSQDSRQPQPQVTQIPQQPLRSQESQHPQHLQHPQARMPQGAPGTGQRPVARPVTAGGHAKNVKPAAGKSKGNGKSGSADKFIIIAIIAAVLALAAMIYGATTNRQPLLNDYTAPVNVPQDTVVQVNE